MSIGRGIDAENVADRHHGTLFGQQRIEILSFGGDIVFSETRQGQKDRPHTLEVQEADLVDVKDRSR